MLRRIFLQLVYQPVDSHGVRTPVGHVSQHQQAVFPVNPVQIAVYHPPFDQDRQERLQIGMGVRDNEYFPFFRLHGLFPCEIMQTHAETAGLAVIHDIKRKRIPLFPPIQCIYQLSPLIYRNEPQSRRDIEQIRAVGIQPGILLRTRTLRKCGGCPHGNKRSCKNNSNRKQQKYFT